MTVAPIAFASSPGRYSYEGTAQLVNAYAEPLQQGKGTIAVRPCDGLVSRVDVATGPCRGMIFMEDLDKLYSVHNSSIYRITYSAGVFTATRIGTIPGTDQVQISRNQKSDPQIVIRSAAGVQVVESDAVSFVLDEHLPEDVVTATVASGYAVYGEANGKFTLSGLNSAKVIDPLDFATFEQASDTLVRVIEHAGQLVGFKSKTLEFWNSVSDPDFPFSPIGFKSRGLKAANAVVKCDGTLIFPGNDDNIHRLVNYDPQVVSTNEIARLIRNDPSPENILGFSWETDGHAFAAFSGTGWTRCYDAATKSWHSRESYGQTTWRARHAVEAWGYHLVGDALSGKIFSLEPDVFTEDSGTMVWKAISPPLHAFPDGAIVDAFHMDLATGYGTLGGSSPKVMLRVSKDGGNTFGGYRELELGVQGAYATRVTARRLGRFGPKGIVFEISISDPVVRSLVSTDIEIRPLKR